MSEPSEPDAPEAEVVGDALPKGPDDLPPIDFSTFIVSLRTSALMHIGQGDEGEEATSLVLARQEIDLLLLLEQKTRGNLDAEEERLLRQVLFDLRTRYVAALDAHVAALDAHAQRK